MRWRKVVVFVVCLLPLLQLVLRLVAGQLSPDPVKVLILSLGFWAITFLWLTLAISSIKRLTAITEFLRYRRMLGLYCWFYASLHLLSVLHFIIGWDLNIFLEEFIERPYMALGIIAWCLLLPLGITSNRWAIKKLAKRWKALHKLVYVIAILVTFHFLWLVRSDYSEVAVFIVLLGLFFAERLRLYFKHSKVVLNLFTSSR